MLPSVSFALFILFYLSFFPFFIFLFFWQYSPGSTPLTGMEAGLLTTTTSSSMCITVIGSEVTGTSCLQHTNRNQLNVALFLLRVLSFTLSFSFLHARIPQNGAPFIRVGFPMKRRVSLMVDGWVGCTRFLAFRSRL